jgi:flagellin
LTASRHAENGKGVTEISIQPAIISANHRQNYPFVDPGAPASAGSPAFVPILGGVARAAIEARRGFGAVAISPARISSHIPLKFSPGAAVNQERRAAPLAIKRNAEIRPVSTQAFSTTRKQMLNINTNILSLTTQTNLSGSQNALSQAINRLSSGKRVNTAADDAAGLAIATSQTAAINALTQGVSNANNGISMIQTAAGALQSTVDNLQRIRTLAVEAGDGSLDSNARANLQSEVTTRLGEIDRVATQTSFNGQTILSAAGNVTFQVGAAANQTVSVDFGATVWTSTGTGLSLTGLSVSDQTSAQSAITAIDAALKNVNTFQATLGAAQNTFQAAITTTQTQATNMSAARAQITDADFATETANLSKAQVLQQAGISVLAQANSLPQQVLKLLQ